MIKLNGTGPKGLKRTKSLPTTDTLAAACYTLANLGCTRIQFELFGYNVALYLLADNLWHTFATTDGSKVLDVPLQDWADDAAEHALDLILGQSN